MKHTPGPWTRESQRIQHGSCLLIIDKDGLLVANADGESVGHDDETCLANARLIAAAPELLEALDDILEQVSRTDAGVWLDVNTLKDHIAAIVRPVIQKATT